MSARETAIEMRGIVLPHLTDAAVQFLDTYLDAGEYEIVISLAAETAIEHELHVPAAALEHSSDIESDVLSELRPLATA